MKCMKKALLQEECDAFDEITSRMTLIKEMLRNPGLSAGQVKARLGI